MTHEVEQGDVETRNGRYYGLRPWNRHGLVLAFAGFMYMFIGVSYLFASPESSRWRALVVARNVMPLDAWAMVWVFIGFLTLVSSRWPPTADRWGYMVLTGWSAGWAAVYAMGVIFEDNPLSDLTGTFIFGQVAFMWWVISGLTNPQKTIVRLVEVKKSAG